MSLRSPVLLRVSLGLTLLAGAAGAEEPIPLRDWQTPAYWTPSAGAAPSQALASKGLSPEAPQTIPTPPLAFVGISPCRVADTRDNINFPIGYGPPFMAGSVLRDFVIVGRCGIPVEAQAVSFNFTVTDTAGPGFLLAYPTGGGQPTVSTLNYVASQTVANAAVVPLGTGGGISTVPGVSGFNLIIDVNGYYAPQGVVSSLNGLAGAVTLSPGQDVNVTPIGQALSVSTNSTSSNVPSSIVRRDAAGGFSAGTVTANVTGNLTGAASANVLKAGDTVTGTLTVGPGNLNLQGKLQMNGDAGIAGAVLTSAGPGATPTWSPTAFGGLGRFSCTYNNNSNLTGLMSFVVSGNASSQEGPLDLASVQYNTTGDVTINTAADTITINRTGLYHFEGMIRFFVTTTATSPAIPVGRAVIKMAIGATVLILREENLVPSSGSSPKFNNLGLPFTVERHLTAGSVVSFTTGFTSLEVPLALVGLGVSTGGYFSGHLIAE